MVLEVLGQVAVVVALMLALATAVVVGRDRLARTRREWVERVRAVAPVVAVLAAVLLCNGIARQVVPDLSWMIDWNLTWVIYELEGEFIVWLQSRGTPTLTAYFSFVYVYGYAFVLVFPVIAYFALPDTRPLRELFAAYTLNYVLGLLLYVIVVAYGPRNVVPHLIEALLYDTYPEYQRLTRQVNRNTNVFPSLHTSLAATVTFLAYRTRDVYPRWWPLAFVLGASVAISTMYLGIHWVTDVIAGIILAWLSVAIAARTLDRRPVSAVLRRFGRRPFDRLTDR